MEHDYNKEVYCRYMYVCLFLVLVVIQIIMAEYLCFSGIGYAMVIISAMVCVYYNMIIAWTFFYLFSSFTSELPWQDCGHEWNTPACQPRDRGNSTETPTGNFYNYYSILYFDSSSDIFKIIDSEIVL